MKVIDILNKIANKEEVPKFRIYGDEYYFSNDGYLKSDYGKNTEWYIYEAWLNDEIEIIEKIEDSKESLKVERITSFTGDEFILKMTNKVNELINKHNDLIERINFDE